MKPGGCITIFSQDDGTNDFFLNMEDWKDQYKQWKLLKDFQIKLLDEGPKTLSQTWLVNQMWCDWRDIKKIKEAKLPALNTTPNIDPWED